MKKSQINLNQRGFALIATIAILSLVLLVALAMVSLSSSVTKSTGFGYHHEIAKANARLALQTALNQLQRYVGPDQRVTANADILSTRSAGIKNNRWLGAWKTTVDSSVDSIHSSAANPLKVEIPAIDRNRFAGSPHTSSAYMNDARPSGWQTNTDYFLGYLVSGMDDSLVNTVLTDTNSVKLYGDISTTAPQPGDIRVPFDSVGSGRFAYHVSGESQKANVNIGMSAYTNEVKPTDYDTLKRIATASSRGTDWIKDSKGVFALKSPLEVNENTKLKTLSFDTINIGDLTTVKVAKSLRHDVTANSYSLFTNPQFGGLKKDLSLFLAAGDISKYGNAEGLLAEEKILKSPHHDMHGPTYGIINSWHNLGARITDTGSSLAEREMDVLYPVQRATARYSKKLGYTNDPLVEFLEGSTFDLGNNQDAVTYDNKKLDNTLPVHPVVTGAQMYMDYTYDNSDGTNYNIKTMVYPTVTVFNPHNVKLKKVKLCFVFPAKYKAQIPNGFGKYSVSQFFELRKGLLQLKVFKRSDTTKIADSASDFLGNYDPASKSHEGLPQDRMIFVTEEFSIPAGASMLFSPKLSTGVHKKYNLADPVNNILSADKAPEAGYFYFDSNVTAWDASLITDPTLGVIGTPVNKPLDPSTYFINAAKTIPNANLVVKAITDGAPKLTANEVTINNQDKFPTIQQIYNTPKGLWMERFYDAANGFHHMRQTNVVETNNDSQIVEVGRPMRDFTTYSDKPSADIGGNYCIQRWEISQFDASEYRSASPLFFNKSFRRDQAPIADWNIRARANFRSPAVPLNSKKKSATYTSNYSYYNERQARRIKYLPGFNPLHTINLGTVDSQDYAIGSMFGDPAIYGGVENGVALFDLPSPEVGIFSLGQLRHVPFSQFGWHPSYILGNGKIDPASAASATARAVTVDNDDRWTTLPLIDNNSAVGDFSDLLAIKEGSNIKAYKGSEELLEYNISYELNSRIFDDLMISSIPFDSSGKSTWDGKTELNIANNITLKQDSTIIDLIKASGNDARHLFAAAEIMANKGGFNVNSTSVEAWTAFLGSLAGKNRPTADGDEVQPIAPYAIKDAKDYTIFSRVIIPQTADRVAESATWTKEDTTTDTHVNAAILLSKNEIRNLAAAVVAQVKKRGPFISMGDFVNRELREFTASEITMSDKRESTVYASPLEQAIENAKINTRLTTLRSSATNADILRIADHAGYAKWPMTGLLASAHDIDFYAAWKNRDLPTWFNQGDILEPLAPSMVVRDDTFIVRAYGDSRSPKDSTKILATAYIEAVVQRTSDFVDSSNNSYEPLYTTSNNGTTWAENKSLTKDNRIYGRKIRIVSTKWLNPEEL